MPIKGKSFVQRLNPDVDNGNNEDKRTFSKVEVRWGLIIGFVMIIASIAKISGSLNNLRMRYESSN
jgi:hypothetical protein